METPSKNGYANVNGIQMYYEIYGQGKPLVLIHGGGSTIQTTFGSIIPLLTQNRLLIGVELQAHGHTSDRNAELSFEQDADDVIALLDYLKIEKADFFGFSNGGTTALQIAIRHPERVRKIIAGSALCKRNGVPSQFWDFMKNATLDQMPQLYKDAYLKAAEHPENLKTMGDKCAKRMVDFKDISNEKLQSIKVPTLIVVGDADVMTPEHAVEMHQLISNSQLAIIPGGHGEYIGEITTLKPETKSKEFIVPLLEKFLNKKKQD
ncbi:alpha/beta fold hydrolase [Flavobacterium lindanitolerans]|uniref:Pimeloyl-ACP methyl ester carboxylesterase n=1 Tax=Flavobacterium lindanitolerans TaxID=428988 RepID=A0A497V8X9_9FLAO|nr:alpha/beta hydrolase [Flavobacterium lindanitolerans]PKW29780.1 pimeloyl-ACP methyl ester carboxylesterase [Flavobacterium lindanitolerans]RLJ34719.1 pimeloyl-ACP methyl ester carboxylesterase [Flavobacterium lindanitolerans]